jgi:hypothetical protein
MVADVAVLVVVVAALVHVHGAVGVAMEATHSMHLFTSMAATCSSSPRTTTTSSLPQLAHSTRSQSSSVTAPHARHSTTAGTCSIANSQPSSSVPAVSTSHANCNESGTTWRR